MTDERNLGIVIRSLRAHLAGLGEEADRTRAVLAGLTKIELTDSGDLPRDADTGQPMTQARRDEIYSKCLPPANLLLGITTRVRAKLDSEYDVGGSA